MDRKELISRAAIELLGANTCISYLQIEMVICDINKSLLPIVEDDLNRQYPHYLAQS